ncbi:MAG: YvcK family protein [Deltaproteobacteria bacterium]|nr:YvcK family protein [Deltaproteobacteria bacterium]
MARPHIVTIGGGTGHYTLLTGLRALDVDLTAIVTMMDSGGSSGRLRDEYGMLPPGDFTRCLIALSSHPDAVKDLLGHRFRGGSLQGHTLRNIIFTALHELTGSPAETVERLHAIFAVNHRVLPVTLDTVQLVVHLENDRIIRGEANLDGLGELLDAPVLSVYLDPVAEAFPRALEAIEKASLVVVGPGDLFTSVIPNLLVRGVREALGRSRARVLYVCNVMTKPNETPGYTVEDFVGTASVYLGEARLDAALYNNVWPSLNVDAYRAQGSEPVRTDPSRPVRAGLLHPADLLLEGTLIRHDPRKLAQAIWSVARSEGWW